MADENSTLYGATQTSQNDQTAQAGDENGFVLDFGDGENVEEMDKSEEKDIESLNIDIEEDKKEEISDRDVDLSQDDLFKESPQEQHEDIDLGDTFADTQEDIKENDGSPMDINLDSEDNPNQEQDNTEKTEDNMDLFNDENTDEKSDSENETFNAEGTQDGLFGESEDNKSIEGGELEVPQPENSEDNADFSFDNANSSELTQENTVNEDKSMNDSNDLETTSFEDGNSRNGTVTDNIQEEIKDLNQSSNIDYQEEVSQDEMKNNLENSVEGGEAFQDLNTENIESNEDKDSSISDNPISQIEENKITSDENQESSENLAQNDKLSETENEDRLDNQNLMQDGLNVGDDSISEESQLSYPISGDESINNNSEESQDNESFAGTDDINQEVAQPDMMNLLGGESVDFSYEENAATIQQTENSLNMSPDYQNESSTDSQNSSDLPINSNENSDNSQLNNISQVEENFNSNVSESPESANINQGSEEGDLLQSSENPLNSTETNMIEQGINMQTQNVMQNLEENIIGETTDLPNNIPQVSSESASNQEEIGSIKSTLSLDEILDSELKTNPEIVDSSKIISNNSQPKTSSKTTPIIVGLGMFLLIGFVVVLAYPSISSERKPGDVVEVVTTEDTTELDPTEVAETTEYKEEYEDDKGEDTGNDKETIGRHGTSPKFETVEDGSEEEQGGINPYQFEEEEDTSSEQETKNLSADYINSKILSFKAEGESYKNIGEKESNEKVIKYATYVIRLCDDYKLKIENGEGLDEESFSLFETKVSGFISKIGKNLGGPDEVETVYTQAKLDDDEEKEATRAYLESR